MHRILSVILAALLLLTFSSAALADPEITVNGNGEALVSADVAVISLGVSARDRDVLKAQAKVNEAIAAIRTALTEAGVDKQDINTDVDIEVGLLELAHVTGITAVDSVSEVELLGVKVIGVSISETGLDPDKEDVNGEVA